MPAMDWGLLLVGLALGTILGRVWEKWTGGIFVAEEEEYKVGYADAKDGLESRV